MAGSASADAPSAPAEETAEKSRTRLRVPTPVVVTVIGIALSAWLVPAFTRQWEDRQKEHEFKAVVVAQMASATAHALVGGEAIWSNQTGRGRLTQRERTRLGDQWALSDIEIEARLRAYFPSDVIASWQVYAWAVDRFIDAHRVSAAAALREVVARNVRLDSQVADATALLLVYGKYVLAPKPTFEGDTPVERREVSRLEAMLKPRMQRYTTSDFRVRNGRPTVQQSWRPLEKILLKFEQAVTARVIAAHAAGYSTSTHDLLRDLVP